MVMAFQNLTAEVAESLMAKKTESFHLPHKQ
jgi:hypothetical protein